jgi:hypothetical protein
MLNAACAIFATLILKVVDADSPVFVLVVTTVILRFETASVGVPEKVPVVVLNDTPAGKVPDVSAKESVSPDPEPQTWAFAECVIGEFTTHPESALVP